MGAQILNLRLKGSYMASEGGDVVGAIPEDEVGNGRPMVNAIAVNVNGGPGGGGPVLVGGEGGNLQDLAQSVRRVAGRRREWTCRCPIAPGRYVSSHHDALRPPGLKTQSGRRGPWCERPVGW